MKKARVLVPWAAALLLAGCASVGVGLGVPVGPFTVGIGVGADGGMTTGIGTGYGPIGVGVGVDQRGQVTGHAGVGASVPLGSSPARVGVGVGTGTVLVPGDHPAARGIPILPPRRVEAQVPAAEPFAP